MLLDTTSKKLQVVLGGAVTTNQLQWTASWFDSGTTPTGASADGVTNDNTAVDVVASPGSGYLRQLKYMSVFNSDTVSATVTIQLYNGSSTRIIFQAAIGVGASVEWTPKDGFHIIPSQSQFLVAQNNLSDVASASSARTNLGLGSLAVLSTATPSVGGTGLSTITAHGVMIGEGTGNVAVAGPVSNSISVLQSQGSSSDPVFTATPSLTSVTVAAGTVGTPAVNFTGDTDCGLYHIGTNEIGLAVNGTKLVDIGTASVAVTQPLYLPDGLVGTPAMTFSADTDTGIYRVGSNDFAFAAGGSKIAEFTGSIASFSVPVSTGNGGSASATSYNFGTAGTGLYGGSGSVSIAVAGTRQILLDGSDITTAVPTIGPDGSVSAPSYSFSSQTGTGMWKISGGVAFSSAGTEIGRFTTSGLSFDGGSTVHKWTDTLLAANNLSDLNSASTARSNLGLGSAATYNHTARTSWSPALKFGGATTGITYNNQLGDYSTWGNIVFIEIQLDLSSKGSASGAATIESLPITPINSGVVRWYLTGFAPGVTPTSGIVFAQIVGGNTAVSIVDSAGNALTDAAFTNTASLRLTGWYSQ